MKNSNTEFYIARIEVSSEGNIKVEDKRSIYDNLDENDTYSKWFKMK